MWQWPICTSKLRGLKSVCSSALYALRFIHNLHSLLLRYTTAATPFHLHVVHFITISVIALVYIARVKAGRNVAIYLQMGLTVRVCFQVSLVERQSWEVQPMECRGLNQRITRSSRLKLNPACDKLKLVVIRLVSDEIRRIFYVYLLVFHRAVEKYTFLYMFMCASAPNLKYAQTRINVKKKYETVMYFTL